MELYKLCTHLPDLPKEFCNITEDKILQIPNRFRPNYQGLGSKYSVHNSPTELLDWCDKHFSINNLTVRYQIVKPGISIHKDIKRDWCYNYILKSGNGETVWYDNDKETELLRVKIPENSWHWINTSVYHTVENIDSTRYSITVFEDQ